MTETLCIEHITDPVLRQHVQQALTETACSFCDRDGDQAFAVPMDSVAQEVFQVITWLYEEYDASTYPYDDFDFDLDTSEVVADSSDGAFEDSVIYEVQEALIKAIATPERWASRGLQTQFEYNWTQFERTVKHESRFVYLASQGRPNSDKEAPAQLARFLDGLLGYADKRTQMLTQLPEGTRLYRARMTDSPTELRRKVTSAPGSELGPAPSEKADAGRMNAQGVSLFYGAFTLDTAVAEVALHSRYDHAVAGAFETQRPLTVLDLTRKPSLPSPFDHDHRDRFMFVRFVDNFVSNITAPVILDGRERIEYVPTQVVTEFLRWAPARPLDGIVFPSRADPEGKNVVLFFGPGTAFRTSPPTDAERAAERLSLGPASPPVLTISKQDISAHSVERRVIVQNRDLGRRPSK